MNHSLQNKENDTSEEASLYKWWHMVIQERRKWQEAIVWLRNLSPVLHILLWKDPGIRLTYYPTCALLEQVGSSSFMTLKKEWNIFSGCMSPLMVWDLYVFLVIKQVNWRVLSSRRKKHVLQHIFGRKILHPRVEEYTMQGNSKQNSPKHKWRSTKLLGIIPSVSTMRTSNHTRRTSF